MKSLLCFHAALALPEKWLLSQPLGAVHSTFPTLFLISTGESEQVAPALQLRPLWASQKTRCFQYVTRRENRDLNKTENNDWNWYAALTVWRDSCWPSAVLRSLCWLLLSLEIFPEKRNKKEVKLFKEVRNGGKEERMNIRRNEGC